MENILDGNYKKEADGKSYFLLNKTKNTYEEQMIREAMPTGVLPMVKAEKEECYKYDITGRKTLSVTFERVPMNAEQVQKVLQGILAVLERSREYLLSEERFILQPEYIFLRIPEYEVTLCYYPEYGVSFSEQMGKLFEMLLNRVDYREEKAIALVYALYMQLQEPDMTLERMREKLGEQAGARAKETVTTEWCGGKDTAKGRAEFPCRQTGVREGEDGTKEWEGKERKKEPFWERFWGAAGFKLSLPIGGRKREPGSDGRPLPIPVKEPCATSGNTVPAAEAAPVPAYVMETAPEWGTQHTRVISLKKEAGVPTLVSEESGETILLVKFPFYIGSLAGYVDYVIASDTVSRFHAKLIKEGEEVFLVDLNSTNGTKCNGRLLNVQERARLSTGDCISFADAAYCYFAEDGEEASLFYR